MKFLYQLITIIVNCCGQDNHGPNDKKRYFTALFLLSWTFIDRFQPKAGVSTLDCGGGTFRRRWYS